MELEELTNRRVTISHCGCRDTEHLLISTFVAPCNLAIRTRQSRTRCSNRSCGALPRHSTTRGSERLRSSPHCGPRSGFIRGAFLQTMPRAKVRFALRSMRSTPRWIAIATKRSMPSPPVEFVYSLLEPAKSNGLIRKKYLLWHTMCLPQILLFNVQWPCLGRGPCKGRRAT